MEEGPKVLYAGWDFDTAMAAGRKFGKPFRLVQFEWRGKSMKIVYDSEHNGRVFAPVTVRIEERLQVPIKNVGLLDVYVA